MNGSVERAVTIEVGRDAHLLVLTGVARRRRFLLVNKAGDVDVLGIGRNRREVVAVGRERLAADRAVERAVAVEVGGDADLLIDPAVLDRRLLLVDEP